MMLNMLFVAIFVGSIGLVLLGC